MYPGKNVLTMPEEKQLPCVWIAGSFFAENVLPNMMDESSVPTALPTFNLRRLPKKDSLYLSASDCFSPPFYAYGSFFIPAARCC